MSLTNIASESGIDDDAAYFISYQELAEHFIQLYWPQALPYHKTASATESDILWQNKGSQAVVISEIAELQSKQPSLAHFRKYYVDEWDKLIAKVARTIRINPAKHLQTPENIEQTFLYHYQESNHQGIELNKGIAYCFANSAVMITKLCQQYWSEFIRDNKNNQLLLAQGHDLHTFLFSQNG